MGHMYASTGRDYKTPPDIFPFMNPGDAYVLHYSTECIQASESGAAMRILRSFFSRLLCSAVLSLLILVLLPLYLSDPAARARDNTRSPLVRVAARAVERRSLKADYRTPSRAKEMVKSSPRYACKGGGCMVRQRASIVW